LFQNASINGTAFSPVAIEGGCLQAGKGAGGVGVHASADDVINFLGIEYASAQTDKHSIRLKIRH
jgi:hypothetical protein